MTVVCSKCLEEKPESGFHKNKAAPSGLRLECKACRKSIGMNYRKIPDVAQKSAVRISEWVKKNPESTKAAQRRHAEKNREMRRQYSRLYQKEHRAQDAERSARQRAEIKRATPNWANLDYIAGIYELCALFRRTGLDWHVDHIIPINGKNVVGFHVENNLQILSAIKNISKGNRLNDLDGGCLLPA